MRKKKEEESGELVNGQRFSDYDKVVADYNKSRDFSANTFKSTEEKSKPKTRRERFDDKFIRRQGGTLARRGTATAQRAENREKNRNRAKAMAKARIAAKKK